MAANTTSGLLGQANFTTGTANRGTTEGQNNLNFPDNIAYDAVNSRLFVADTGDARVLAFKVAPGFGNGENASNVLGQTLYTTNTTATTQSGMNEPGGLAYDANSGRLFSADDECARVMVFNAGPSTIKNGMNASYVLGPSSFTLCFQTIGQSGLSMTQGSTADQIMYDPGSSRLFVVDTDNNRVMIFDGGTISTNPNSFLIPGYE